MKTYEKVFNLLRQSTDYISGEKLAQDLNLSRTSVWKAIQHLEKDGVIIDSIKNRGYKIIKGDILIPEEIEKKAPITISYNPNCQSTQLDAKAGLEHGNKENTLYLASSQSSGVGRFGRSFFSPNQGGIYMSLHLKPNLSFDALPTYTILTAGAIYKAIKDLTLIDTDIKWVNDIYYKDKKIAGILTEAITSVETGLVTDVIIGVGLNFSIKDFPSDLQSKVGSLFDNKTPITRNELIIEIWKNFYEIAPEELIYLYKQRSIVLNRTITFEKQKKKYKGVAKAVSNRGQLLVQLDEGEEIWLNSGEISLTSW